MTLPDESLEDRLDRLVARYSDLVSAGGRPDRAPLLAEVPAEHRPALDRCFDMVDRGAGATDEGLAPAPIPLGPGVELGGYRIVRPLGRGGMAMVFLAEQLDLGRTVALKVLRPGLALEPRHVDRFRREARAIGRLNHRNVIQVYDVGEAHGHHFIAMEHVPGPSLAEVLGRLAGPPPWRGDDLTAAGLADRDDGDSYERRIAATLARVLEGLAAAHDVGVVHRDLKPSNILIDADGRPVVADFGLAQGDGDLARSLTGAPVGTPYYMSPEQVERTAARVDERSDVYSLGVTLFEALAGERPFRGDTALQVFESIRHDSPPPLRAGPRVPTAAIRPVPSTK